MPPSSVFLISNGNVISTFVLGCLRPMIRREAYSRVVKALLDRAEQNDSGNLLVKYSVDSPAIDWIDLPLYPHSLPPKNLSLATSFAEIISDQEVLYGKLEGIEKKKIVYQAVFGGTHFLSDISASHDYLLREWEENDSVSSEPLAERISPESDLYRINLRPAKERGICPESLFQAIQNSARIIAADLNRRQIRLLPQSRSIGIEPGSIPDRSFHHSEEYRRDIKPSYRLIHGNMLTDMIMDIN